MFYLWSLILFTQQWGAIPGMVYSTMTKYMHSCSHSLQIPIPSTQTHSQSRMSAVKRTRSLINLAPTNTADHVISESIQAASTTVEDLTQIFETPITSVLHGQETWQYFHWTKENVFLLIPQLSKESCDKVYLQSNLSSQTEEIRSCIPRCQQCVLSGNGTLSQTSHRIHCLCSWYKYTLTLPQRICWKCCCNKIANYTLTHVSTVCESKN